MSAHSTPNHDRNESPDPGSHILNIYDNQNDEGEWFDGGEDDDMDFEPTTDASEDTEFFEPSEDADIIFHDAEDGLSGVEIEVEIDDEDGEGDTVTAESEDGSPPQGATLTATDGSRRSRIQVPAQIVQMLGQRNLRQLLTRYRPGNHGTILISDDEDDEDDDDAENDVEQGPRRRTRRQKPKNNQLPTVPSKEGRRLMNGGVFGASQCYKDNLRQRRPRLANRLMHRETGSDGLSFLQSPRNIAQDLLPSSKADKIIHYGSRCYSGQFSDDGNFFFSCAQDFKVRMYDTSNPYAWKYYKTVIYPYGQWTITDATLSPDNRYLAYSSIRSTVCLSPTDPGSHSEPWLLDFSDVGGSQGRGWRHGWHGFSHFGIWSIRFSGDGREIVAGTAGPSVCVYDIERRQSIINIEDGHSEDVNAVCFGDTSSPHILYSGSDDTLIKVWDRRSLGDGRAAGVFMGHTEGLTYVDSKGDGRYVLSNGKDQSMKLWDLRKMMSTEKSSKLKPQNWTTGFDYRFMPYSDEGYTPHPHDCSLVTYRGHSVLKTLIRCHFSPPGSTNSRYVYSGSEDGSVYIYNIDATLAGKVDVRKATEDSRPKDPDMTNSYVIDDRRDRNAWKTCVRDASWHPNAPVIAATSWNGWGMTTGTCTTHSWNDGAEEDEGNPRMGQSVDQRLVPDKPEEIDVRPRQRGTISQWSNRLRSQRVTATESRGDDGGNRW